MESKVIQSFLWIKMTMVKCPKCEGVAWLTNGDGEIYCPECEQAQAELYGEIEHEEKMLGMQ